MPNASPTPPLMKRLFGGSGVGTTVLILLVFYVLLLIVFSFLSPFFMTLRNMTSISSNIALIGLMAAAGTPLIIAGGLDLSVAAVAGLTGVIIALLYASGTPIWLAVLAAVAVAVLIGIVNGVLATYLRLNPLIVTLATMSIVTGVSLILTGGLTKPLLVEGFNWIGQDRLLGVPVPALLMLAVYVLLWLMMQKTHFGRHAFAVGGNPDASRLIGLPVDRTQITLYVMSAVSGAIAGTVLAAMLGAAAPNAAGPHLLTVIAAIILGGTSLQGGRGSVWGTLVAVLILGTLNNGLTLMNVTSFWQDVTRGIVLILAVGFDGLRQRMA
ncbi:ABC transporter permease [Pseudoruegeria sp. SHC-113]|nr:ABC transporter permease [Pseudoruegeria sp. SHC-113]